MGRIPRGARPFRPRQRRDRRNRGHVERDLQDLSPLIPGAPPFFEMAAIAAEIVVTEHVDPQNPVAQPQTHRYSVVSQEQATTLLGRGDLPNSSHVVLRVTMLEHDTEYRYGDNTQLLYSSWQALFHLLRRVQWRRAV